MVLEQVSSVRTYLEVLDRVLDKGIVIDAQMRVSLAGLDLLEVDGRAVMASINTYLTRASALIAMDIASPARLSASGHTGSGRRVRQMPPIRWHSA
jgi:hypothetical protein